MRGIFVLGAVALISAACASACTTETPTDDEQVESAAWGYTGNPSSLFLSAHGLGNREESQAYYAAVLNGGSSSSAFTLEKWKTQFIASAPTYKALYKNKFELGFWREMTCTQLIARGVGGCFVTNWSTPEDPTTAGTPNQGTVAMNVSSDGFARFYVFLPDGKLSPSAVLDQEGPKFLPRLCTVCHSGANPQPGKNADLGSVFREFEPELLETRPGITRVQAEQEWFRLNRVVQQANHAIRSEADGSPYGTDHAKKSVNDRIDTLYIPGGEPDKVPDSWSQAGPEAKQLWSKVMVPYCLACHRHNLYDWTDYGNFEFFKKETAPGVYLLKNYLPDAPDPNAKVAAMPQAALSFDLMKKDAQAKNAIAAWLGERGRPCESQTSAQQCTVGDVDLTTAGCTNNGGFRQRTCEACGVWGNFSASCDPVDSPITIATTEGAIAARVVTLDKDHVTPRPSLIQNCPISSISTTQTPFAYVEVKNPSAEKTARVTVYNSRIGSLGPIIDTILVAYSRFPTTDAQRKACVGGIGDFGTTSLTGDAGFASLDGSKAVTIPPNASVHIYIASYEPFVSSEPSTSTGNIKLTVRTDSLQ